MVEFPGLESYFMASYPKNEFVQELLEEYYTLLKTPKKRMAELREDRIQLYGINKQNFYAEGFTVASLAVIQYKQREINRFYPSDSHTDYFAIDYYGLHSINALYFPEKIQQMFGDISIHTYYQLLAQNSLSDLEDMVGPLRYVLYVPFWREVGDYLFAASQFEDHAPTTLHPASLFSIHLYKDIKTKAVQEVAEHSSVDPNAPLWSKLPKNIWLYEARDNQWTL